MNELPARIWVIFHISIYADGAKQNSKGQRANKPVDLYHPSVKSIRNEEQRIYVSTNFQTFEMTVDLNNQADSMAKIKELTSQVSRPCDWLGSCAGNFLLKFVVTLRSSMTVLLFWCLSLLLFNCLRHLQPKI